MPGYLIPVLIFAAVAVANAVGMWVAGWLLGPRRQGDVKQMPYESGMDPIHDARRRFDVRFYLVAIAFLIFDVELLFLYPWAVASGSPAGFDTLVASGSEGFSRALVFGEVMVFLTILALGLVYVWRKGVLSWR